MSEAYIGEIRMFGFDFAPRGWATCAGQLMPIAQNQALFSLLGTTYGGNGVQTFALPDLRGRAPVHMGQGPGLSNYVQGQVGGVQAHTLGQSEMPSHTHLVRVANTASTGAPETNAVLATPTTSQLFRSGAAANVPMAPTVGFAGGNQAHENMQPFTVLNFSIAIQGIFPSRN